MLVKRVCYYLVVRVLFDIWFLCKEIKEMTLNVAYCMKRRVKVLSFTYGTECLRMLKQTWNFIELVNLNKELFFECVQYNVVLYYEYTVHLGIYLKSQNYFKVIS